MNAHVESPTVGSARPRARNRFALLLRREYWEHKGGFLWTPLVAGAISLLLTLVFIVIAHVMAARLADEATIGSGDSVNQAQITLDSGRSMSINGLDLGALTQQMGPGDMRQLADGIDITMLLASTWPFIVLGFVMFFYCLGALYDERRDRSVLFWKSLPVSDGETVLSKVASATLVAPLIATVAALVTMLLFLSMLSIVVMIHGGNPIALIWGPGSPMVIAGQFLAAIPVYALWALPTVGWLMLCSVAARSKPFLWALMIPVLAGVFVSMFDVMQLFQLETGWFWKNIVGRMLLSVAPLTWLDVARIQSMDMDAAGAALRIFSLRSTYSTLATPHLWVGAAAGVAMLLAAVRLRRWRDEG